jgi:hypothetical protein
MSGLHGQINKHAITIGEVRAHADASEQNLSGAIFRGGNSGNLGPSATCPGRAAEVNYLTKEVQPSINPTDDGNPFRRGNAADGIIADWVIRQSIDHDISGAYRPPQVG